MKIQKQKITPYTLAFLFLCAAVFAGQYLYNQLRKERATDALPQNISESADQDEGERTSDE